MRAGSAHAAISKVSTVGIVIIIVAAGALGGYYFLSTSGGTTGTGNLTSLIQAANAEGSVTIYSTATTTALQAVAQAFQKQYPSIKVNTWSGSSNDLTTKVTSEANGGVNAVDVIGPTLLGFAVVNASNLITTYNPPEAVNMSSADKAGNYCYGTANYYVALLYNTKQVNASQLPDTWLQLVQNSAWTGKIGIGDPTLHFTTAQWLLALKGPLGNDWSTFTNNFASLKPRFYHSLTPVAGGVASGDVAIGVGLASDGATLAKQGAPIAVKFLKPIMKFDTYVCLAAKAPHPNAAKLLLNFFLSQNGQQAEANIGDQMVRKDVNSPFASELASASVIIFGQQTVAEVQQAQQTTFKQIFG